MIPIGLFFHLFENSVVWHCQHIQNQWRAEHKVINEFLLVRHGYEVEKLVHHSPKQRTQSLISHSSMLPPATINLWGCKSLQILADPKDQHLLTSTKLGKVWEKERKEQNCIWTYRARNEWCCSWWPAIITKENTTGLSSTISNATHLKTRLSIFRKGTRYQLIAFALTDPCCKAVFRC